MNRFQFRVWYNGRILPVESIDFDGEPPCINHVVNDGILMQSTGLKDKTGAEIFDGDILTCGGDSGIVVVWDERTAGFGLDKIGWAFRHFFGEALFAMDSEVIGNIHQNPELIGKP